MENNKKKLILIITVVAIVIGIIVYFLLGKNDNNKSKYVFVNEPIEAGEDIISYQQDNEVKIKEAMENKDYTLENPYVIQNPYGTSPLTALVIFQTKESSIVNVTVNNNSYEVGAATKHLVPIYGLLAGKTNDVIINVDGNSKTITINTTEVKNEFTLNIKTNNTTSKDLFLLTEFTHIYGYNNKGELNWVLENVHGSNYNELSNGNFIVFSNEPNQSHASYSIMYEMDYLGKIYNSYEIANGVSADVVELPNNNLLVVSSKNTSIHDTIIEIDRNTGKKVNELYLYDYFKKIDSNFVVDGTNFEISSLYYNKNTNELLISISDRNSIVSINYDKKTINWIFGNSNNWGNKLSEYLLISDIDGFSTTNIDMDKNGNYTLFYNGFDNTLMNDECSKYANAYSKGIILNINDNKATVVNEFSNKEFFSYAVSNYYELDNGNYLLSSSWELAKSSYETANCDLNSNVTGLSTTIYEVDSNNNVLFKATYNNGTYANYKLDLFKNIKNYSIVDTKVTVDIDDINYKTLNYNDIIDTLEKSEKYNISLDVTKNYINIYQSYGNDDEASLILVSEDKNVYEFIIINQNLDRSVINLRDLKGKFALFYKYNGTYYNLNVSYEI